MSCPPPPPGRMYGADEFLPMLTYVLSQCDMPQLDNEILYMMELLDPSLLHGEGTLMPSTRRVPLQTEPRGAASEMLVEREETRKYSLRICILGTYCRYLFQTLCFCLNNCCIGTGKFIKK